MADLLGQSPFVRRQDTPVKVDTFIDSLGRVVAADDINDATVNVLSSSSKAISRAARIAAYARGPMVVPSARANSTAVTAEQTLKWSDNSLVVVGTAGTTAASEPAGLTDGRPLTDGTAVVYHTGWKKSASDIDAPTITYLATGSLAANGLTETVDLVPSSGIAYMTSRDGIIINRFNGVHTQAITNAFGNSSASPNYYADYAADTGVPVALPTGEALAPGFVDGDVIVEDSKFAIVGHTGGINAFVLVDGQPLAAHRVLTGSGNCLMLDFNGVVKPRVITLCGQSGDWVQITSIVTTAQGRVRAVSNRVGDNLLILGDSFTNTVSPNINTPHTAHLLKRYMGFEGVQQWGLGGSGVTVRPNVNSYNHREMLSSPVNRVLLGYFQPKHVLVYTGTNDVNFGSSIANSADETVRLWDDIHSLLPNAKITTVDCTLGTAVSGSTNHYAYAAAIKEKHARYATPNMRLIEAVGTSTSTAWVYGTGQISTALGAGTGNASYYHGSDNSHPGPAGARFRARQIANEMIRVWESDY